MKVKVVQNTTVWLWSGHTSGNQSLSPGLRVNSTLSSPKISCLSYLNKGGIKKKKIILKWSDGDPYLKMGLHP